MASDDPMVRAEERVTDQAAVQVLERPKRGKTIKVKPNKP